MESTAKISQEASEKCNEIKDEVSKYISTQKTELDLIISRAQDNITAFEKTHQKALEKLEEQETTTIQLGKIIDTYTNRFQQLDNRQQRIENHLSTQHTSLTKMQHSIDSIMKHLTKTSQDFIPCFTDISPPITQPTQITPNKPGNYQTTPAAADGGTSN